MVAFPEWVSEERIKASEQSVWKRFIEGGWGTGVACPVSPHSLAAKHPGELVGIGFPGAVGVKDGFPVGAAGQAVVRLVGQDLRRGVRLERGEGLRPREEIARLLQIGHEDERDTKRAEEFEEAVFVGRIGQAVVYLHLPGKVGSD
jgi:hypothetical protein